ncbi:MAG: alpha/beta hydrolase [Pseudomonadota bacterium]|nr:alpha/beta hydrolase [Pseudomonadota bacterium]
MSFFEPPRLKCTAAFRWLDTPDGKRIRCGRWEPVQFPSFTVVILPGRGEFIEKYDELAGEINKRKGRVLAIEWRGQGKSSRLTKNPQRGHVRSYDDHVADMKLFMNSMVRFASEGKVFWFPQSMGALIALLYLAENPVNLEGIIFTSPMADLVTEPFPRRTARALASFGCNTGFAETYAFGQGDFDPAKIPFENNPLTSDKGRFDRMRQWLDQEQALRCGGPTFGWMDATFRALEKLGKTDMAALSGCDKLILSAPDDRIVPFRSQQALSTRLSKTSLKTYEGARHELWMETDTIRKAVWKDVDDFMGVRIPYYVGGGTDRIRPDARLTNPAAKPPAWRPGTGGQF